MNQDGGSIFLLGVLLGAFIGVVVVKLPEDFSSDSYTNQVRKAIEVCEANLPRTQHCEIKGVVKE